MHSWQRLVLTFTAFNVECDYDWVTVTAMLASAGAGAGVGVGTASLGGGGGEVQFSGGCPRQPFSLHLLTGAAVSFSYDSSVSLGGFNLTYAVLDSAPAGSAEPGGSGGVLGSPSCPCAAGRGKCLPPTPSACTCQQPAWTGEDCSGYKLCPGHPLCPPATAPTAPAAAAAAPAHAMVVLASPLGTDGPGRGSLGLGPAEAGKPLRTLGAALDRAVAAAAAATAAVSPRGGFWVLVLPGVPYSGRGNTALRVSIPQGAGHIVITSLRGGQLGWGNPLYSTHGAGSIEDSTAAGVSGEEVVVDCEGLSRALNISLGGGGHLEFVGITFQNCFSPSAGGAVVVHSGRVTFRNCRFVNCSSSTSGGALALWGSTAVVFLVDTEVSHCSAGGQGGGVSVLGGATLWLNASTSLHSNTAVEGGGVYVARGSSVKGESYRGVACQSCHCTGWLRGCWRGRVLHRCGPRSRSGAAGGSGSCGRG